MKNNMKKIIIGFLSFAFLLMGQSAFAFVAWNNGAQGPDCPGSAIGNYTTGVGIPNNPANCWNNSSVSASSGDSINVQLYYHNTGDQPATNTKVYITVSPALGQASTTHTFTSSLSSNQGGTPLGVTHVNLSTAQALSFGSTYWYPNQGSTYIVSGNEIMSSNGLLLGTINPGWPSQGSTVTSFLVGTTPPPQNCAISNFSANPTQITSGGSSTLSWNTSNCTSASISPNVGNVNVNGSQSVSPTTTTTYTLTAHGSGGNTVTQTATVSVQQLSCTIQNFSANPIQITSGGSSTLSWNTSNCTSASISPNFWNVSLNGSQAVSPTITTTYTLTANGSNGSVTQSVTVNVTQIQNCVIQSFTANPTQITSGGSSTLSWSTSNCTTASISPNIGSVPVNGSQAVFPTTTKTYTLTATGQGGGNVAPMSVTVFVNSLPTTGTLTPSMLSCLIPMGGNSCAIPFSWNTVNPPVGSISAVTHNGSTVATGNSGNQSFTILNGPQSYYLYNSSILLDQSTVTASCSPGSSWNGSSCASSASCSISSFTANPMQITSGGSSTLSWNTSNCTSANIVPNFWNVSLNGSQAVTPTVTTTYTLTALGSNGVSVSQAVSVSVNQVQSCIISSFTVNGSSSTTIQSGGAVNLVWNTNNCLSVTVSGPNFNSSSLSGSQTIYPTSSGTYTLTPYGASGSYTAPQSVYVSVTQNNCTISNFTANGSSSTTVQSGGAVNLVWNTNNCNSVYVSGPSFTSSSTNGSQTIYPTYSGTYVLTASSSNSQSQTQSVFVTVNNNQNSNCYISNFTANGSSSTTIQSGNAVNLVWSTSGNNCTVTVSGPNFSSYSTSGSQTIYPTYSGTYTLTAYSSNSGTQTQSVYVSVNNYQYNNCTISYFTASPTSINYGGLSTLSWSTSNCTSVSISNLGSVNTYGSQTVYPTSTTNYSINAYGSSGTAVTQTVQVAVNNYVAPPIPINNTCAVTSVATNVTRNSATLNGLLTNTTYNSSTYFEYGTDVGLGSQTSPKSTNGNTSFSDYLTGLSPNTIYFFRLVSNCNNSGLSRGSIEIFQTSGNTTTTTIIRQGTTVVGTASPIMLKIENRYQSIKVGDSIDYTITYKNISSRTLTHPILQVVLPKGVTYLNSSRGTYSSDTYTLTVSLEDLVPNVEGVVYVQGRVDSIDTGNAQIVTTALLVYTAQNGAQENAIAYVLNNPMGSTNSFGLGAAALFGSMFGMGILGWLLLLILILLAILLFRKIYRKQQN